MEAPNTMIKNSQETSRNLARTKKTGIPCFLSLIIIIYFTIFYPSSHQHITNDSKTEQNQKPTESSSNPFLEENPFVSSTCAVTPYPFLCLSTLSILSDPMATPPSLLEHSINRTIELVSSSWEEMKDLFTDKKISTQENAALNDCIDLLDQTVYELTQAIDELQVPSHSYGNVRTLLSAAMTNEHTCIDGLLELEKIRPEFISKIGLRNHLQSKLTPIVQMISNSLAVVKHLESERKEERNLQPSTRWRSTFLPWMSRRERRLMGRRILPFTPDVVVAADGNGDVRTVGEAVKMAPNMSLQRFVIKIKAGVYMENVEIPREKVNVMLFGGGMNSTIISGNRSFADGFSTFVSATLTVVGDRFLARDLTVENTASQEKFQAVAIRVTSNSVFYRCNFTSHQDTLYAHSLRQLYRECTIQGTIDFIFGNAAAIFQNCLILARKPILGQSNMITAQSRDDPNQNTGFSLQNCTIESAADFSRFDRRQTYTFLGRPWRNFSRTIIMKSYLGSLIHPRGWSTWDKYSNLDTVEYEEYMNVGPGAITKYRVRWGGYKKNYTKDLVKRFTVEEFLDGSDIWLRTTGVPLFYNS